MEIIRYVGEDEFMEFERGEIGIVDLINTSINKLNFDKSGELFQSMCCPIKIIIPELPEGDK